MDRRLHSHTHTCAHILIYSYIEETLVDCLPNGKWLLASSRGPVDTAVCSAIVRLLASISPQFTVYWLCDHACLPLLSFIVVLLAFYFRFSVCCARPYFVSFNFSLSSFSFGVLASWDANKNVLLCRMPVCLYFFRIHTNCTLTHQHFFGSLARCRVLKVFQNVEKCRRIDGSISKTRWWNNFWAACVATTQ